MASISANRESLAGGLGATPGVRGCDFDFLSGDAAVDLGFDRVAIVMERWRRSSAGNLLWKRLRSGRLAAHLCHTEAALALCVRLGEPERAASRDKKNALTLGVRAFS